MKKIENSEENLHVDIRIDGSYSAKTLRVLRQGHSKVCLWAWEQVACHGNVLSEREGKARVLGRFRPTCFPMLQCLKMTKQINK